MTQQHSPPTAKIYEFPKKPRASAGKQTTTPQSARPDTSFPMVEFGAGWYHEAAVEDAVEQHSVGFRKH